MNDGELHLRSFPPSATSVSLLARLRQHDPQAWHRLVEVYGPLVYDWCRQQQVDADDAKDIVQEVFCAVHAGISRFQRRRPGDSFRGWLWTITRKKISNHFRLLAAQPQAAGGSAAQAQWQQVPQPQDIKDESSLTVGDGGVARRALEAIRPEFADRNWQMFWRFAVDGVPAAEVAAELNTTPKAVRQAKFRVISRMRRELQDLMG